MLDEIIRHSEYKVLRVKNIKSIKSLQNNKCLHCTSYQREIFSITFCFLENEMREEQCQCQTGEFYQRALGSIAPVVEIAEAECCVVVVLPVDVELVHLVVDVLAQLDILSSRPAAFILVSRDVDPECLQGGEAVSGDQSLGPLPLYQFDTLVVVSGAELAPVPPVVEIVLPTARVCPHTDVTDQAVLQASAETLDQGETAEDKQEG